MQNLAQKNIDQYLDDKKVSDEQKEKVIVAITQMVYNRNQNVVKAGEEKDEEKSKKYAYSVKEYDEMIANKIDEILNGKTVETYDF